MRSSTALLGLVCLWVVCGCEEPRKADTREWAHYYVDRMHDTKSPDSTEFPAADSLVLDSVTSTWTTDDWIRFWQEVEKEQKRRREAALRLEEAEREAKARLEAEALRQADSLEDTVSATDSVTAADST